MQLECTGLDECDYIDCNFIEFIDVNEWKKQALEWEKKNSKATHHIFGLFLSYKESPTSTEIKFQYPSVSIVKNKQFLTWRDENMHQNNILFGDESYYDAKIVYYKLDKYHISRVFSSKEWFIKNLPTMENIWKRIEYYRTENGKKELEKIKKQKKVVKVPKEPKVEKEPKIKKELICLF
jgi:phosphopantetheinyl transferase (holo-ACP synthase)